MFQKTCKTLGYIIIIVCEIPPQEGGVVEGGAYLSHGLSPPQYILTCKRQDYLGKPEASSIMRALSGARCTGVRLYTL